MAGIMPNPPVQGEVEVLEGETASLTLVLPFFEPMPRIAVMPDHDVHFGPVGLGTTFTRVVRVANMGAADLNVSVAVTGDAVSGPKTGWMWRFDAVEARAALEARDE